MVHKHPRTVHLTSTTRAAGMHMGILKTTEFTYLDFVVAASFI